MHSRLSFAIFLLFVGRAHAQLVEFQSPDAFSQQAIITAPICTDRPTKANVVCTVPEGKFQVEGDVINWTRFDTTGGYGDIVSYSNATIKYGLTASTDIQLNFAPLVTARSQVGGVGQRLDGISDLVVRLKQDLSLPNSSVQVALIPYIKAPAAQIGLGNGQWEGGVIAPIIGGLPDGFVLNFGPQIDVLADFDDWGYHPQFTGLINISKSFGPVKLYAEIWTAQNFDTSGVIRQVSADFAAAYLISSEWQLDIGGNFGLNRATPDAQLYLGVSNRF